MKEGQYYYRPHRSSWGVWKTGRTDEVNGARMDEFVDDFPTQEEASAFVYKKNGWKKPENKE